MIISEKGLCKAMNDAAAHGGYKLRFNYDDDTLTVLTEEWLVNVETEKIPRKVLGLIVEHFGYIPEGGCYCVRKKKDEVDIQNYMHATFSVDVLNIATGNTLPALYTGITVWNRALYVSEIGTLRGAEPVHFGLLEIGTKPSMVSSAENKGKSLMFADEESSVFISICDSSFLPEAKQTIWDSLEQINWWNAKEDEYQDAADEGEQMNLHEREEADNEG